jgi:hypothetical protein
VIVEAHDVWVGLRRLPEHAQHLRLALEPRQRLRGDRVWTQHLDDDEVAVGLVPGGGEDPSLATLPDALAQVKAPTTGPLKHLPAQQVAQGEQPRVGEHAVGMVAQRGTRSGARRARGGLRRGRELS